MSVSCAAFSSANAGERKGRGAMMAVVVAAKKVRRVRGVTRLETFAQSRERRRDTGISTLLIRWWPVSL